jgi:predicted flap endonuclease-1-like 5' DNA nuclease
MAKLENIEGVGELYAHKLKDGGITSTQDFLEKGATAEGRREIAERSGISETLILRWVNQVDLARINGVSEEYGELLEVSGVDSIPELAQRNPENLFESITKVNQEKHLVRRLPTQRQVHEWIDQAKTLPRIITH